MSKKNNISYVLIIRRILIITSGALFAILFWRMVSPQGYSNYTFFRERFELDLLQKKGPLVSTPFRVNKRIRYYQMTFTRNTPKFIGDSLFIHVKVLTKDNKVIDEFTENFLYTAKTRYSDRWHHRIFKTDKDQELRVVLQQVKSNLVQKRSTYNNFHVKFKVSYATRQITMRYYYPIFSYIFFAMIIMLFVPKTLF